MAKSSAAKKPNGRIINIDWTDVEEGKGGKLIPEGSYEVKILEVEKKTSDSSGEDYLGWEMEVVNPKQYKGTKLYYNTSLQHKSLWNLRGVLEVLGIEIPDGPEDLDLDDLIDRTAGVEVQRGEYNGKPKNEVVDFFEFSEKKSSSKNEEEEKKKTVTYTEDEILEKNEDELGDLIKEHSLDVNLEDFTTLRRQRAAVIEALEGEGLIDG